MHRVSRRDRALATLAKITHMHATSGNVQSATAAAPQFICGPFCGPTERDKWWIGRSAIASNHRN